MPSSQVPFLPWPWARAASGHHREHGCPPGQKHKRYVDTGTDAVRQLEQQVALPAQAPSGLCNSVCLKHVASPCIPEPNGKAINPRLRSQPAVHPTLGMPLWLYLHTPRHCLVLSVGVHGASPVFRASLMQTIGGCRVVRTTVQLPEIQYPAGRALRLLVIASAPASCQTKQRLAYPCGTQLPGTGMAGLPSGWDTFERRGDGVRHGQGYLSCM